MLRFFAKYQKVLLVVGGSILMVIFLLPAGGQFLQPDPSAQAVGTVNGRTITYADQHAAAAEIELLSRIAPNLRRNLPDDPLQWLLLVEEARRNGIYASTAQARSEIDQMAAQGVPVAQLLQQSGVTDALLVRSIQHAVMILQLSNMIIDPQQPSEPRLAHIAQAIRSQATVDVVPIDADALLPDAPAPTDEQVQQLYDKYKDVPRGRGEPYGFGYYLPRRVKLEYISVPLARVSNSIEVDEVDAQKFYATHPERYMPPAPEKNDKDKDKADAEPAAGKASGPLPYRDVRDRVIDELSRQLAQEKQNRIVKQIGAELAEHTRTLKRDDDGYYILPDGYTPPSFEEISRQIQQDYGVLPDVIRIDNRWMDLAAVGKLEGFGSAGFEVNEKRISAAQYISTARQLDPPANNPLAALHLQINIASRPMTDNDGDEYIFRLTAADPARAPKSLDEVKDQVVADAKRLEAYKLLKERAQKLLDRAQSEGMDKLAESFKTKVTPIGPFSGRDLQAMMMGVGSLDAPVLPIVGQSQAFIDAVFDLGQEVAAAGGVEKVNDAAKMTVVPIDGEQKVAIVKLTEYQPVDIKTYEAIKPRLPLFLSQLGLGDMGTTAPLSLEAVKKRVHFVAASPADEDEDAPAEQPAKAADQKPEQAAS